MEWIKATSTGTITSLIVIIIAVVRRGWWIHKRWRDSTHGTGGTAASIRMGYWVRRRFHHQATPFDHGGVLHVKIHSVLVSPKPTVTTKTTAISVKPASGTTHTAPSEPAAIGTTEIRTSETTKISPPVKSTTVAAESTTAAAKSSTAPKASSPSESPASASKASPTTKAGAVIGFPGNTG